jgi:hypothetical protein
VNNSYTATYHVRDLIPETGQIYLLRHNSDWRIAIFGRQTQDMVGPLCFPSRQLAERYRDTVSGSDWVSVGTDIYSLVDECLDHPDWDAIWFPSAATGYVLAATLYQFTNAMRRWVITMLSAK